jgi:hypothetical protein
MVGAAKKPEWGTVLSASAFFLSLTVVAFNIIAPIETERRMATIEKSDAVQDREIKELRDANTRRLERNISGKVD